MIILLRNVKHKCNRLNDSNLTLSIINHSGKFERQRMRNEYENLDRRS